jgi:heterodisulfide reductase subunit A
VIGLTVDGKRVEVEEGSSLLEAAEKAGIKIPTLCYHKALKPYGSCRVCLVEIERGTSSTVQASCTFPAQENLVVHTGTERVLRARRMAVELLLSRCPDSQEVQQVATDCGIHATRFAEKNMDCTLCGRCVRMCEERMGRAAISFVGRGSDRDVTPPFAKPTSICQVCGACAFVCPTGKIKLSDIATREPRPIPYEFNEELTSRPAIYISYPQAVPNRALIDRAHCAQMLRGGEVCRVCTEFCEADAIKFDQKEESHTLDVGAIVAVPGFELYDAAKKGEYGFGLYKNVVTSVQFERILSASGPSAGEVVRPSDGKHPKRIAFIQCVGSREATCRGNDHCSSICCMYSTKEAIIAREHDPRIEPTIFFIDLRAFGKDFEKYYESARKQHGVRYQRCMVSKVSELQRTKNLRIKYVSEEGTVRQEEFDLVVLAVGLEPASQNERLARTLGISLDEHGFCQTSPIQPNETSRAGIFTAGPFLEPKDIPETVVEASSAAAGASRLLAPARGKLVVEREYPPEMDVSDEEPRIGVFVCRCGRNIGGIIDVPAVVEYVRTLPDVAYADENLYTCSQDSLVLIKEKTVEDRLNRVVVASCTPRTHEMLFRETLREVGLNPYLFEMCSLREHCSWVHMNQPKEATEKAKEIVRMAVAKARLLRPIKLTYFDLNHKCLVVGGGLAGMTAAVSLAEQGFDSYLVEKEESLGGNLRNLRSSLSGYDPQALLAETVEKVVSNPRIQVLTGAQVVELSGYMGNFKTTVQQGDRELELEHGAIIVATGAAEYRPTSYLYGQNPRVVTQNEFEEKLAAKAEEIRGLKGVVMIQCVGSRDEERPYCSRVCCGHAIKNALKLKELNPSAAVFILYRDVRTYGFKERVYREAREKGIVFVRYDDDRKPVVSEKGGKPVVEVLDAVLREKLLLDADFVVLSTGMVPSGNEELARILKVPLTSDGFFLEAHAKIRPLDFATDGIYVCGLAHSPKYVEEAISQANGAAIRAVTLLSKEKLVSKAEIVRVNERMCTGCGICVSVCPYDAREIDDETKKARILYVVCQGCGACAAACPNGATVQNVFEKEQILEMVDSAVG